jgi:DNA/RNA endonuclease YhcR with UshA esterase domain
MRTVAVLFVLGLMSALVAAEDKDVTPISPAEAAKNIDKKCTVEMEVKSTGKVGNRRVFLNSEANYRDGKNFTVMLGRDALAKFKKAKVEDAAAHFKGKTIRVTGTVKLYNNRPEIAVDDPSQITVVEKKGGAKENKEEKK